MLLTAIVAYALSELRAELGELSEATMMKSLEVTEHAAVLEELNQTIADRRKMLYELQASLETPEDVEMPVAGQGYEFRPLDDSES
jgi:chromosome segregation ATPase